MQREIIKYPDPILSTVCSPVQKMDDGTWSPNTRAIITDMFDTMDAAGGCGLAANQVAINARIIVVDLNRVTADSGLDDGAVFHYGTSKGLPEKYRRFALINPAVFVVAASPRVKGWEGCLSCPGPQIKITRRDDIVVKYLGTDGNPGDFICDGFLSRVIQHEVDHLNGLSIRNARPDV